MTDDHSAVRAAYGLAAIVGLGVVVPTFIVFFVYNVWRMMKKNDSTSWLFLHLFFIVSFGIINGTYVNEIIGVMVGLEVSPMSMSHHFCLFQADLYSSLRIIEIGYWTSQLTLQTLKSTHKVSARCGQLFFIVLLTVFYNGVTLKYIYASSFRREINDYFTDNTESHFMLICSSLLTQHNQLISFIIEIILVVFAFCVVCILCFSQRTKLGKLEYFAVALKFLMYMIEEFVALKWSTESIQSFTNVTLRDAYVIYQAYKDIFFFLILNQMIVCYY